MSLTFKEFLKLSHEEKCVRYKELNSRDRFLARMNDWGPSPGESSELTIEQFKQLSPDWQEFFREHEPEKYGNI